MDRIRPLEVHRRLVREAHEEAERTALVAACVTCILNRLPSEERARLLGQWSVGK